MEASEYDKMFAAEDRHFWFRGKRAWITALIEHHLEPQPGERILDVGCGTGANLLLLERWGEAFGVESEPVALAYCRQRGLRDRVVAGSANALPIANGRFALACALDVLYHRNIEPGQTLREIHRVLQPGGHLLITDSALPALASPHDRAVWARERFTRRSLRALVEGAGFEILRLSYANCLLLPLVAALRMAGRFAGATGSGLGERLPPGNAALFAMLRFEAALIGGGINLPWGSSILCVARRF